MTTQPEFITAIATFITAFGGVLLGVLNYLAKQSETRMQAEEKRRKDDHERINLLEKKLDEQGEELVDLREQATKKDRTIDELLTFAGEWMDWGERVVQLLKDCNIQPPPMPKRRRRLQDDEL